MPKLKNEFGQPIGDPVPGWTARPLPAHTTMAGRFCRIEQLDVERHADDLFEANKLDKGGAGWTYLFIDPFETLQAYRTWIEEAVAQDDPFYHAIVDAVTGKAVGVAAYMRQNPTQGVIEVGSIRYSPLLQRTPAATEAMYLMMARVFDELGYRRYEWKCDSLNEPSCRAARRLGFTYEGTFRQAVVYKGRNRDTAWFSIIDSEWPALKRAYQQWLNSENFDDAGQQRRQLADLIAQSRQSPGL